MKELKWLTFFVLFSISQSVYYDTTFDYSTTETTLDFDQTSFSESTIDYQPTFADSSSESSFDYHSTAVDSYTESNFDYQLNIGDARLISRFDYQPDFKDLSSEENQESSLIKKLLYPPYDRDCPLHEHWEFCTGHCQRNCSNWSKALICPDICIQGCLCDWGFTRGPEGNCIPVSECPPVDDADRIKKPFPSFCRSNEHFSACDGLPLCQKSCSNYNESVVCPLICVPGCVCDEGYVIGPTGECIPREQCSFEMKSTSAKESSQPKPSKSSKSKYKRNELFSKMAFGDSEANLEASWPAYCEANERFSACNGLERCQETCSNYKKPFSCPFICVPGCICDDGFVKGPEGKCIPVEQCPPETIFNSIKDSNQPNPAKILKSKSRNYEIFSTVSSTDSAASEPEFCQSNKHYSTCDGLVQCQKTCSNYNKPIPCSLICMPGCICDAGFVKGPEGKCILLEQCPAELKYNSLQDVPPSFTSSIAEDKCPNELSCTRKCRLTGHSYGICIGVKEEQCACF